MNISTLHIYVLFLSVLFNYKPNSFTYNVEKGMTEHRINDTVFTVEPSK